MNVLNFGDFDGASATANTPLVCELDEALSHLGFSAVRNIGIEQELIDSAFACSREFFDQPFGHKMVYEYAGPEQNFGYQPTLSERLSPDAPADLKEAFTMRNLIERLDEEAAWPSPRFKAVSEALFKACFNGASQILQACALALGERASFFEDMHSGENATLRFLHYPCSGFSVEQLQMGAGAHTDYGSVSLLFQNKINGLQLRDRGGNWVNCLPVENAVNVNTGDMMERWSNRRYPSTEHRVLPKIGDSDRYSIAFFMDPDDAAMIEVLPACVVPGSQPYFPAVRAGQYIQEKIKRSQSS